MNLASLLLIVASSGSGNALDGPADIIAAMSANARNGNWKDSMSHLSPEFKKRLLFYSLFGAESGDLARSADTILERHGVTREHQSSPTFLEDVAKRDDFDSLTHELSSLILGRDGFHLPASIARVETRGSTATASIRFRDNSHGHLLAELFGRLTPNWAPGDPCIISFRKIDGNWVVCLAEEVDTPNYRFEIK